MCPFDAISPLTPILVSHLMCKTCTPHISSLTYELSEITSFLRLHANQ